MNVEEVEADYFDTSPQSIIFYANGEMVAWFARELVQSIIAAPAATET